jgi:hypothetical protein
MVVAINSWLDSSDSYVGFLPALVSNLLPLGGIFFLGWRVNELIVIYWTEVLLMLVIYAGAALFAKQPIVAKGRTVTLPGVSRQQGRDESKWSENPEPIKLGSVLPPMYPRNIRLIVMTVVWALGLLLVPVWAFGYGSAFAAAFSVSLLGTIAAMAVSHGLGVRREVFSNQQYNEMSAHMVLEIPGRIVMFGFCYVLLLTVAGVFGLLAVGAVLSVTEMTAIPIADQSVVLLFVTAVVLGKTAVEWSKHRAEVETDPSGFATWFLPENPHQEEASLSGQPGDRAEERRDSSKTD